MGIDKGGKLGVDELEEMGFDICFRLGPACNDLDDMARGVTALVVHFVHRAESF